MVESMSITAEVASPTRALQARRAAAHAVAGPFNDADAFWALRLKKPSANLRERRRELIDLVNRVSESPGVVLFHAVEAGVPTCVVNMIAGATGEPITAVMDLIGVSQTTFRRKEEAKQRLPDVAGHRVMGYLRVVATLRRLLNESGEPEQLKSFDVEAWVAQWMREALPELGGKTPAEMLRNPEGQRAVEQVLERMRGGLAG